MQITQKYFTTAQRKKAKAEFKKFKVKSPYVWEQDRDEIISAILSSKPTFELKVSLI